MEGLGVSSINNLQALSALLAQDDGDEEDYKIVNPSSRMGPGDVGPPAAATKSKETSTPYAKENTKDIWKEEEVPEGSQYDDLTDPRPQPDSNEKVQVVTCGNFERYEIVLKQSVGTEDLFLGMSRKDPSSMCCEGMLVKVKLPGTKATDVVLDVKEKFLDLRTPKYKLGLHLPHPVHHQNGKAQFYSEREELEVCLHMNRIMDSINLYGP